MFDRLILTCEHGGHEIPAEYQHLFEGADEVLESHRGWDPGALELAKELSHKLHAPLFHSTTCRLLIELNRSLDALDIWSEFTSHLFQKDKEDIIGKHYRPYREHVEAAIGRQIDAGKKTLHLSVHSCTPVLDGAVRFLDLGILFDPDRPLENEFAEKWKDKIAERDPGLLVEFNYPYLGIDDGFTTTLRKVFPPDLYAGVEIEVNQKYPLLEPKEKWEGIKDVIRESLRGLV